MIAKKIFFIFSITLFLLLLAGPVKAQVITHEIVFAVNQDYAVQEPNWQVNAQEIIDYANQIFNKTTNVRFSVAKFLTYDSDYFEQIRNSDQYFSFEDYPSYKFATTIFYWQPADLFDETKIELISSNRGFRNYYDYIHDFNNPNFNKPVVKYRLDYLSSIKAGNENYNILKGKDYLNNKYGNNTFENNSTVIIHELGHTFGIAVPDIYLYNQSYDKTFIEPQLEPFDVLAQYGYDPMITYSSNEQIFMFNELNSFIINQNINYKNTALNHNYYRDLHSKQVKVVVKDYNGLPIDNALVYVYGSRNACADCNYTPADIETSPLLEIKRTESNGEINIEPTTVQTYLNGDPLVLSNWLTKIVKVFVKKQSQAKYFTTYDLQKNKTINNADIYKLEFVFPLDDSDGIEIVDIDQDKLLDRVRGLILLQVESLGQAWYINPVDDKRYYLGRPQDAFTIMKDFGLGIMHAELIDYLNSSFPSRLAGKILLDVEQNGEAWYVYPQDLKAYYLGRPADAFAIMQRLGLGISDQDLKIIPLGIL